MAVIDRIRPADRHATLGLHRRVVGPDVADARELRWDWLNARNPHDPDHVSAGWVAREGPAIIGHYQVMPVRLRAGDAELAGSWGTELLVAPERERQGLGELIFNRWDAAADVALALGPADDLRLFAKHRWPSLAPLPCLVKPLSRRALRRAGWPKIVNQFVSAVTLPVVKFVSRSRPLPGEIRATRSFGDGFTRLWEQVAGQFDLAVVRDADYLDWRYLLPPHVRYLVAVAGHEDEPRGYVVYRHVVEPRGRVTLLVDFFCDPGDETAFLTLLRWVDREARANDSDKIRTFATHGAFRHLLKRSGYFEVASRLELAVKVNQGGVAAPFYRKTDRWHVTLGDSIQDH